MKVSVLACRERIDGQWMITYRAAGAVDASALSPVEVPVGADVIIRDGKVVKS